MKERNKQLWANLALLVGSCVFALLLCELGCRLFLNPVDYLSPVLIRDPVLGIRIPGKSGGHDAWGFRNAQVPSSADIVALGDSHTYGNTARMNEAWPLVLARVTGLKVYNLAMGGYGPNQYYHLLKTKGMELKPHIVICGLYMGDDFDNAYRITYGLDYWAPLRSGGLKTVDPDIWEKDPSAGKRTWHKRVRNWLSSHSMVYRLLVHHLLVNAKSRYQLEHATKLYDSISTLILPEKNIEEAFLPNGVLIGLDQQDPNVREGMRLTERLLQDMNTLCATKGAQFIVAVIPTKETVFARYIEHNPKLAMNETLDKVIVNERLARQALFASLEQNKIPFIDLLPALESASEKKKIYNGPSDMHPNKDGYRVIGETIAEQLKKWQTVSSAK
jgi:SGNH hydrolase-like domain, acetyltransferase AlgX